MASYADYILAQKLCDLDIPELANGSVAYSARLHEIGLYDYIQENLEFYKIFPADSEAGLNDQQRFQVEQSVQQAFVQAEFVGKRIEDELMIAVAGLEKIRDFSNHLLYSAKAENMQARWAEDYYRGYFAQRQEQIERSLAEGRAAELGDYNNEGGASYHVRYVMPYPPGSEFSRLIIRPLARVLSILARTSVLVGGSCLSSSMMPLPGRGWRRLSSMLMIR